MTLTHCPKNNLNLFIKTEPHTVRADDTVCVWLMGQIYSNEYCTYSTVLYSTVLYVYKCQKCFGASAPAWILCGDSDYIWDSATSAENITKNIGWPKSQKCILLDFEMILTFFLST